MRDRPSVRRWSQAWVLLCLALALHVADEAMNGFLDVWNPTVLALREQIPALPLPTFRFGPWLAGLALAVAVLLTLARWVGRGARWMVPVAFAVAVFMLGNGLLHVAASVAWRRAIPGVYSSPVLIGAALFLLYSTWHVRGSLLTS